MASPVAPMARLQHIFYNAVRACFSADPSVLQLNQPAKPMTLTDAALWAREDLVPPASLTFNTQMQRTSRFSAEYRALAQNTRTAEPSEFQGTMDGLVSLLKLSPGVIFEFDSFSTSSDVTDAWADDVDPSIFGLWTGLDSASPVSVRFATSGVTVAGTCGAYAVWVAVPGNWYDSATLNAFFTTTTSPPWPPVGPAWVDFFGEDGRLPRMVGSLLVLDGLHLTVMSGARFSPEDQALVIDHVAEGTWPLFIDDNGITKNTVRFTDHGMTLTTTVPPGHPFVLGHNVIDTARYLGHTPAHRAR